MSEGGSNTLRSEGGRNDRGERQSRRPRPHSKEADATRILLLIEDDENRRLLSEWLDNQYDVVVPDEDPLVEEFDLCIVDGYSLERHREELAERKEAIGPRFLPYLFVTPRQTTELASSDIWDHIDEVITTPIKKGELAQRIEVLLRIRNVTFDLEQSEERFRTLFQAGPDPAFVVDAGGTIEDVNEAMCRMVEREKADVVGCRFTDIEFFPEDAATTIVEQFERAMDGEDVPVFTVTLGSEETRFAEVNISPVVEGSERVGQIGIIRNVTERQQRENELAALNEMTGEFVQAQTAEQVSEIAVEAARSALNMPITTIALYDDETGVLAPTARTEQASEAFDGVSLFDREVDLGWQVFVENEEQVHDDLWEREGFSASEIPLRSAVVVPLGKHGVLVTGSTAPAAFDETDLDFVELLASNTEAALDRAERELLLQEQTERLEDQNESLERINRTNDIIRDVDQALVGASTREEIEQAVCNQLGNNEPYVFAWTGEHDAESVAIQPREWAGVGEDYLEAMTFTTDEATDEPVGTALRTRETQVVQSMRGNPPLEPWREAALKRGYRTAIAIPLVYEESLYGVLSVYADRPDVFNEQEQAVLTELGNTIAYAINAIESKRALMTDSVVELEFKVRGDDFLFRRLAVETDSEVSLKGTVPQSDDTSLVFVVVRGADTEDVETFAEESVLIEEVALVNEHDDECVFEFQVSGTTIASTLADHGALSQQITAAEGVGYVVAELPRDADVRSFVELFQNTYPDSELLARRERERPLQTSHAFHSEFLDRLTDRQTEVLQAAFFSDFFEWPRGNSGTEIAESLDISQPTFHHHLRAAQRKLIETLLETDSS